jgi:hypothetical protein
MLQSVAYTARIRNGYCGRNGRAAPADTGPIPHAAAASAPSLRAILARAAREAGAVLVGPFEISPTVMLERCQARHHEGKIICPRNQKAQIKQFEQGFPWIPCRHGAWAVAAVDRDKLEAAVGSAVLGFGSDVVRAKDKAQAVFRHINPHICGRCAPGYGFDNCNEMFASDETSG